MKYIVKKALNVGDIIEKDGMPDLSDFIEEVKHKYTYIDTGNEIKQYALFWFVYNARETGSTNFSTSCKPDLDKYSIGNCFELRENAEKELAYRKARATIKRFINENGGVPKIGEKYYFPRYNSKPNSLINDYYSCSIYGEYRFASEEALKKCIASHPEELKLILGVE